MVANDSHGTAHETAVRADGSQMRIRTNRIGPLKIHATAPVVNGHVSDSDLVFSVRIDHVDTGNPLLDPELHALIGQITDGILVFQGRKSGRGYAGTASAGAVTIPLELSVRSAVDSLELAGQSRFSDINIPLPGLGHIKHLEVDINGRLHLA